MKLAGAIAMVAVLAPRAAADTSDREQIVVTDVASDLFMGTAFIEPLSRGTDGAPFFVGLAGAVFGGPTVHAAHGDWGRAGLSLGARVVAPVAGMLIGDKICMGDSHPHGEFLPCFGSMMLGGAVGLVGAEVLDWTAISRGAGGGTDGMPAARMVTFGGHF